MKYPQHVFVTLDIKGFLKYIYSYNETTASLFGKVKVVALDFFR